MVDIERKFQELIDMLLMESKKEGITIKYNIENMVVSKRGSVKCKLQIGTVKIK